MTSVRIWPRCRFGVRFRVWAPKVSGLLSLGWFVAQAEPWKGRRRCREGAQGERERDQDPSESDVLWGRPSPLWRPVVPSRQGPSRFHLTSYTYTFCTRRHGDTHTHSEHTHTTWVFCCCRLHLPLMQDHASHAEGTPVPGSGPSCRVSLRLRPTTDATGLRYPYSTQVGRPHGWCCP